MFKRYIKVLSMNRKDTEIELNGKQVSVSKKEKMFGRIGLSIAEFIPIFMMMLILNNPQKFIGFEVGTIMGFLIVTVLVMLVFVTGLIFSFVIYLIGTWKEIR